MMKGKLSSSGDERGLPCFQSRDLFSASGLLDLTDGRTFLKAEWAPRCGSCFFFPTSPRRAAGKAFTPIPLMEKSRPREVKPAAWVICLKKTQLSWLPALSFSQGTHDTRCRGS